MRTHKWMGLVGVATLLMSPVTGAVEQSVGARMHLVDSSDHFREAFGSINALQYALEWEPGILLVPEVHYRQNENNSASLERVWGGGLSVQGRFRFTPAQSLRYGLSAGLSKGKANTDKTLSNLPDTLDGRYWGPIFAYDYQLNDHFGLSLSWSRSFENYNARRSGTVLEDELVLDSCNINCTSLTNIIYNPYAGLPVKSKALSLQVNRLELGLSYRF